jgi:hypothetical protein
LAPAAVEIKGKKKLLLLLLLLLLLFDLLCGLVVRVPGYISRGLSSTIGATTFSKK